VGYDRRAAAGLQRLTFEADELGGFDVLLRPSTVEALALIVELDDIDPVQQVTTAALLSLRPLCREFASLIVAWNLEENGDPVPVSAEAFLALDAPFVLRATKVWVRATLGLPQTLTAAADEDEDEFDESVLPMEPVAS
jgi:hypothetical protein